MGYSHKILFKLPSNIWLKINDRRRNLIIFSFDYILLTQLTKKIKNYYLLSLYKIRGFLNPKEKIKLKKGKSKLGGL